MVIKWVDDCALRTVSQMEIVREDFQEICSLGPFSVNYKI